MRRRIARSEKKRAMTTISWLIAGLALVLAAGLIVYFMKSGSEITDANQQASSANEQKEDLSKAAVPLAESVLSVCRGTDEKAKADLLRLLPNACSFSQQVVEVPVEGPAGPGPSAEEIQTAVTQYCAVRAECRGLPTLSQVTEATATYLAANPPSAGRPPTMAEIANAVNDYCAADSNPCRGAVGEPGPAGRGPTTEEIMNQVMAFCGQPSQPCQGPSGAQGPQGVNFGGLKFEDAGNGCEAVVTLVDPRDGSSRQERHLVSQLVCPPVETTTSTSTPTS